MGLGLDVPWHRQTRRGFTELATVHGELAAREQRLTTLIANLPGVVYRRSGNNNGQVDYISPMISNLSGYPASEFLTGGRRQLVSLIHPADVEAVPLNGGAGADVVTLRNGNWVMIYNDVESGRHSLAVSLSEDEGKSWPWTRRIELDPATPPKTAHYPAIVQGRDGELHASYSYFLPTPPGGREQKTIRYATFNEAWIRGR